MSPTIVFASLLMFLCLRPLSLFLRQRFLSFRQRQGVSDHCLRVCDPLCASTDKICWVIDRAAKRGLYVAMLPVWGSSVKTKILNRENVGIYARWLAARYKDKLNIFWILCGDILGDISPEAFGVCNYWHAAIDEPGAVQMQFLKRAVLMLIYLSWMSEEA
jgi:hypothetical protein